MSETIDLVSQLGILLEKMKMKKRIKFISVSIALVVTLAFGVGSDPRNNNQTRVKSFNRASSPGELLTLIRSRLSASPKTEMNRLLTDKDSTVALAWGWERVRRTVPEADQQALINPDSGTLSRFLGLVEGRLQVPIPEKWEATIRSAKGNSRRNIWFSYLGQPGREGDLGIVGRDNQAAVCLAMERAYIAIYQWPPIPYKVLSIDLSTRRILWVSEVWAAGTFVNYEGIGWHRAEIRLVGETVAVFGVSEGCAYVETFDKATGKNLCRFSTAYLDEITRNNGKEVEP
jgi:hypothetical protein